MDQQRSRRTFLKSMAGVGAGLTALGATGPLLRVGGVAQANERLNVAFVGTDGIANRHMNNVRDMTDEFNLNVVAYADVDRRRQVRAARDWRDATAYQDYRRMFDEKGDEIDVAFVATPDHSHFPATMIAMQAGIHVYTEKPLTHTLWEARELTKAHEHYSGVVSQMGIQGHAGEAARKAYEYIASGKMGTIKEAHFWTDRPAGWWPQGAGKPEREDEVPNGLDWDLWLGPAKERAYASQMDDGAASGHSDSPYHPFNWRGWFDFGTGALGDIACHAVSAFYWAMKPEVEYVEPVVMSEKNDQTYPQQSVVRWRCKASGDQPAYDVYWYSGGMKPGRPEELEPGRELPRLGGMVKGTQGQYYTSGTQINEVTVFPESLAAELGDPEQMLARSPGHTREFLQACRGEESRDHAKANFGFSAPFTEFVLLGALAERADYRLYWDAENLRVTNWDDANQWVDKEYRDGWRYTV